MVKVDCNQSTLFIHNNFDSNCRREKYPDPVDLIGITRDYSQEVDFPVRHASMSLMRSIPRDFKVKIYICMHFF